MASLPIFSTSSGREADIDIDGLSRDVLGGRDLTASTRGATTTVRGPDVTVDVDRGRGGIWAGDVNRMWTVDRVSVPKDAAVAEISTEALKQLHVVPELGASFRLTKGTVRRSQVVTERGEKRTTRSTEATFGQDVVLDVSSRADVRGDALPVFGGGGRFRTTVGDGGQVVGVHGVWRGASVVDERPLLSLDSALERVGASRKTSTVRVKDARLGYYSAPAFRGQELLFPVYAVTAEVHDGKSWVPSRVRLVPATDVGQVFAPETAQPKRSDEAPNLRAKITPQLRDAIRPGMALPPDVSVSSAALAKAGLKPSDVLTRTQSGGLFVKPTVTNLSPAIFEALRPRSFGASWIGTMGGLSGSQGNAQGFVDQMTAEGWQRRFNWGNEAAWKSDWTTNDDQYVDDVDIVFYTGHASPNGWQLATAGKSDWLHHSETGATPNSPSDLWGQNNLEWAIIAACGPLQDDIANGGGNVFNRWRGAFDGLHLLLGYAAVTFDNQDEGRRFASYARSGMTLRQAWFRTAQEIQPSTNGYSDPYGPDVYAAVMYTGNSQGSTYNDHLWGHGSVGPDVRGGSGVYRGYQISPC